NGHRLPPSSERSATVLALLLDLLGLTAKIPQVVELGSADVAAALHLDLLVDRGMDREGPLHADPEAHLANGEGLLQPATGTGDHHTGEDLDPGPVALDHLHVHPHRVTGPELRHVGAEGCLVDLADQLVHVLSAP